MKGSIAEKTYFKVTLENDITQPSTTVIPYNGVMPTDSEHFRLTVLNQNQEIPLAKGKEEIKIRLWRRRHTIRQNISMEAQLLGSEANIPSALTLVSNVNAWNFEIALKYSSMIIWGNSLIPQVIPSYCLISDMIKSPLMGNFLYA